MALRMCLGILIAVFSTTIFFATIASAAPSNQTINFSARLKSASGVIVPDGFYNITFRLYTQQSGGSPVWTEVYHDSNGTTPDLDNRVKVVNGYLSVKLGALQAFSTIDWNDSLWMTMDIGGTSQQADIGQISWDGEMTPRIQLSAVPYAMNANTVGGKSADQLVQLGQGTSQEDTSSNASIAINKTGSGNLIELQASGADIFTIHNSGSITLGATTHQAITVSDSPTGIGHNLTVAAGAGDGGGALVLQGGNATSASASGGSVVIDAGSSSGSAAGGSISIGSLNAQTITLGNTGSTTTVQGNLHTSTVDSSSAADLVIGGTNASSIALGQNTSLDGTLTAKNKTDSTHAFTVQNASGASMMNVDTQNSAITLGVSDTTGTLLVLDTKTNAGDPTGTNGAMYYNAATATFRCFENNAWTDCITPLPVSKVVETDTTNATTNPVDVTGLGFTLVANTKYYYKFIIIHESSSQTAGIGFGITAPDNPAMSNWCVNTASTLTSNTAGHWGSYCGVGDASATTTGAESMGTQYTSTMEGYFQTGEDVGDLQLRMKSSTTAGTTVKAGSFGILQIVQ